MIKLDIINEVVNKTGITKTKAEMAVETVFEKMKRALEQGDRIELRGFGVFTVKPRNSMRSPCSRAFFMDSKTVSTAISALVFVMPVLLTTSLMISSLIKQFPPGGE